MKTGVIAYAAAVVVLLTTAAPDTTPAQTASETRSSRGELAEARRLSDAGRFEEAATVLRRVLAVDPGNRDARSLLARVLAWSRHFDESIAEYRRLLADNPDDALTRAGYARVLAWSGHAEESLPEFRRAIAADSTNLETRVGYARAISWTGDLPGAAMEYRRILRLNPRYGDAWLGYGTVARWRGAATASDRFLSRAEAFGADPVASAEERTAVEEALSPAAGIGWSGSRERQYVDGPDFTIENSGPFVFGRATLARAADVTLRAAWPEQFERAESGTLNYDLDMTVLRADLALLRGYPFQAAGGIEGRTLNDDGGAGVLYPLGDDDDFFGWNARAWWFIGRLTPSLGARRDFLAIKSTSGPNVILPGDQTTVDARLEYQWNGRGRLFGAAEHGDYSDGNERLTGRVGGAYKFHMGNPSATLDYELAVSDYDTTSRSYFTPLESVRNTVGLGLGGYDEDYKLDYGARYQFSYLTSENFDDIRAHALSGYLNGPLFGPVRVGLDVSYARDNNDYESWGVNVSTSVRWWR